MEIKDWLINILGFSFSGGFSVLTFIEDLNPVFQFLGLVVGVIVGVTVIIINIGKYKKGVLERKEIQNRLDIDQLALKEIRKKDA